MLPIDVIIPELQGALAGAGVAVLVAPPGAGKTTRVPLALLDASWLGDARIVMLEPRRLAARGAATYMARLLGERVGDRVGYRMRSETRVSARTRIEVVTEGVLGRMIVDDPSLDGIGALIFDEFHERSVHADIGLALAIQARELLRPELRILVMSATIAAEPVAALLGHAPIVRAEGRAFPVERRYLPRAASDRVPAAVASAVMRAIANDVGDVLAFLPGEAEIRGAERVLRDALPADVELHALYAALPQGDQDRAIAPSPSGARKVVLATSIAETSLTIEGVRVVVDGGFSRVARFSPRSGMRRLETVRVSRDSADQRSGRAGRTAPGVSYRLWPLEEDAHLVPHRSPEILETDLAPLALDLAVAGIHETSELRWLDVPPPGALAQARELLRELGAIGDDERITPHGRLMSTLAAHPRLAHMMLEGARRQAAETACTIAALLGGRDILRRGDFDVTPVDIRLRLDAVRRGQGADVREEARRLRSRLPYAADAGPASDDDAGILLALAYPDRVAMRRPGRDPRFVLRNGRGALIPRGGGLETEPFIVIAELDDRRPESRVFLAAPLTLADIQDAFAADIRQTDEIEWDDAAGEVIARRHVTLGAIKLSDDRLSTPDGALVAGALLDAIRRRGLGILSWRDDAIRLRARLAFLHRVDAASWPDVSDDALVASIDAWLAPHLGEARRRAELDRVPLTEALISLVPYNRRSALDELAPERIDVPSGSRIAVDYSSPESPVLAVRLQELFGLQDTPRIGGNRVPLTLHLLSPAHRPMQVTRDLAGFWRGAYFAVRKELRARYPRHHWPEDPLVALPARGPKRRG